MILKQLKNLKKEDPLEGSGAKGAVGANVLNASSLVGSSDAANISLSNSFSRYKIQTDNVHCKAHNVL